MLLTKQRLHRAQRREEGMDEEQFCSAKRKKRKEGVKIINGSVKTRDTAKGNGEGEGGIKVIN